MQSVVRSGRLRSLRWFSSTFSVEGSNKFSSLQLLSEVITVDEEKDIIKFLRPILARKRYEGNHWDDVIQQYKELELGINYKVPVHIQEIMKKVESKIEESIGHTTAFLSPHVIDLSAEGYIGPHIDSVKFSGGFVAGLSLQSTRIMALAYSTDDPAQAQGMYAVKQAVSIESNASSSGSSTTGNVGETQDNAGQNTSVVDSLRLRSYSVDAVGLTIDIGADTSNSDSSSSQISRGVVSHTDSDGIEQRLPELLELVLPPRSLYILRGPWRYNYNHAILGASQTPQLVAPLEEAPTQRTSIIFRDVKV